MSRRSQAIRAARNGKAAKRWPQKRENPIGVSDRVLMMGQDQEYVCRRTEAPPRARA
jgi:hypothetical protein